MGINETPDLDTGAATESARYRSWLCVVCGFVYNEREGIPDEGIAPGTRWDDVPDDWVCDDCGAGKGDFEMIEI